MEKRPLELKTTLQSMRDEVQQKLIYETTLSIQERKVYGEWLDGINKIIRICTERNRF